MPDLPIAAVIREFVVDLYVQRNIAVCCMGDDLLFVMKGSTPEQWEEAQRQEVIEDLNVDEAINFIKEWGQTYPFIQTVEERGEVIISYRRLLTLDFRHPQFFDHLQAVLEYVAEHDDLLKFSLRPEIASSSDHD